MRVRYETRLLAAWLCAAALPTPIVATLRSQEPASFARTAPSRGCVLRILDGAPRADGADYRCAFDARGAAFTPALGFGAQRAYPTRFEPLDVARGDGTPTPIATAVAPRSDDAVVRYARAPGVEERWTVRPDGVELSFSFARRPAGAGDLVVRVAVETDLRTDGAPDPDGALRFTAGALGGVRIGAVTGVDATGWTVPGRLGVRDGAIELRLPAELVDSATYPLVLDPLIGTVFGVAAGSDDRHADVAFDFQSQRYLVVWQRVVASNDFDVMGQLLDVDGIRVGSLILIRDGGLRPSVCSVRQSSRFLVAWEGGGPLGSQSIRGRCVEPDGGLSATATLASVPGGGLLSRPRLGGNARPNDTGALLIWQQGSDVVGSRVVVPTDTAPPSANPPNTFTPSDMIGLTGAAVSKSASAGRWLVAWSGTSLSLSFVLQAQAVSGNGALLANPVTIGSSGSARPSVDGDGTSFVVAYRKNDDPYCRRVFYRNTPPRLFVSTPEIALDTGPESVADVAISFLGPKYLVAWSASTGGLLDHDIEGIALDPSTCQPCGRRFYLHNASTRDYAPAIASQRSGSTSGGDEALLTFTSVVLGPPFTGEVRAQRFEALGGRPIERIGGGCGGPYNPGATGPVAVGNTDLQLWVTGVSGASSAYLAIGVPTARPFSCGRCLVTPPLALMLGALNGNAAFAPLPIDCTMLDLVGAVLETQWWVLGGPQPYCSLAPNLTFSDRSRVTIAL